MDCRHRPKRLRLEIAANEQVVQERPLPPHYGHREPFATYLCRRHAQTHSQTSSPPTQPVHGYSRRRKYLSEAPRKVRRILVQLTCAGCEILDINNCGRISPCTPCISRVGMSQQLE